MHILVWLACALASMSLLQAQTPVEHVMQREQNSCPGVAN